jgi:hypothetical protein
MDGFLIFSKLNDNELKIRKKVPLSEDLESHSFIEDVEP